MSPHPISRKICRNCARTFISGWRWPEASWIPWASKLYSLNFFSFQEPLQKTKYEVKTFCMQQWISSVKEMQGNLTSTLLTYIQMFLLSSYNRYKLNSLLAYFQQGSITQLVEHHTSIAALYGIESHWSIRFFFWAFFAKSAKLLHNCEDHFHE